MSLQFRNIDATPDDPVQSWGVEGLLAAIERGNITHWARIVQALEDNPAPTFRAQLHEALDIADAPGAVALLSRALDDAADPDGAEIKHRMRLAWRHSGLTHAALAEAAQTSRPRITAYMSGAQAPTTRVAARIERVARAAARRNTVGLGVTTSSPVTPRKNAA